MIKCHFPKSNPDSFHFYLVDAEHQLVQLARDLLLERLLKFARHLAADALDHLLLLAEEVDHLHQHHTAAVSQGMFQMKSRLEVFSCPSQIRQASA